MLEFLEDPTTRKLLIVVGIIVLYHILVGSKKEGFVAEEKALQQADAKLVLEKRMSEEEIPIKPAYIDADVRTLMAGSGFTPQSLTAPWAQEPEFNKYGIVDGLDDGAGGSLGLSFALHSPQCCSEQYPPNFPLKNDKFICNNKDEFGPSPYFGSNSWQNAGCLCAPKKFLQFMSNRGNNA